MAEPWRIEVAHAPIDLPFGLWICPRLAGHQAIGKLALQSTKGYAAASAFKSWVKKRSGCLMMEWTVRDALLTFSFLKDVQRIQERLAVGLGCSAGLLHAGRVTIHQISDRFALVRRLMSIFVKYGNSHEQSKIF